MELDRRLDVGDRVRILSEQEIRERMEWEYMPEDGGTGLRFAPEMFAFCGLECEVVRIYDEGRYILKTIEPSETLGDISYWVWCPSMLEDAAPEQELEPDDEDFIRAFFAEAAS